jgi:hypothetical protein
LKALVAQSAGIGITFERSERNAGTVARAEFNAPLIGTEFEGWGPGIKTTKRQLGEVMRQLIRSQDLAVRAITRKVLSKSGREWPTNLESRHTVSTVDGTDDLGTSGEKVLIVDLVQVNGTDDAYEVVFTGGTDTLRNRVSDALAARCGDQSLTATDLLGWFRGILETKFEALKCAGVIYCPGDSAKLDRLIDLIAPRMLREIGSHDYITGAKLSKTLMQGLNQKLDKIESDFATDCVKARERDMQKVRDQNESHTEADLTLAADRAVVLPERAATYLARLIDCNQLLVGLAVLLGDDTAPVRARLAALRATIEPLCDDTARMAANIELDDRPSDAVVAETPDLPSGPCMLELD